MFLSANSDKLVTLFKFWNIFSIKCEKNFINQMFYPVNSNKGFFRCRPSHLTAQTFSKMSTIGSTITLLQTYVENKPFVKNDPLENARLSDFLSFLAFSFIFVVFTAYFCMFGELKDTARRIPG